MNATYTLTEGNEALNRVLLMMRYDLEKTLSENIVLEQPDSRFETQYNKELMRKYDKPSKTMTLDEFMEDFRDTLTHPVMVGLEVFLTSTGVGVTGVVAAYTALLAYDVYKGITTGDWDWLDIVFDILGIVSSGVISGTLRPIMQGAKGLKLNTLGKTLTYLSKTKAWSKIKPLLKGGTTLLKTISKGIKKSLVWISEKTGFTQLKSLASKVESTVGSIVSQIVKFLEPGAKVGTKKAITRGVVAGSAVKGLEYVSKYLNVKIPKWTGKDNEEGYTKWLVGANPKIYGKNIKYTTKPDIYGNTFTFLRDVNGNFYIYDIDTKKWNKIDDVNEKNAVDNMFFKEDVYAKQKFDDFQIDNTDKNNPIFTLNGVDYKLANNNFKLKKI